MFSKHTRIAIFLSNQMFTTNELIFMKILQNRRTGMARTTVPETGSKTIKVRGKGDQIEIAKATTSRERNPRLKVKYRETNWIKENKSIIVSSEFSHRNQFLYNLLCV